MAKESADAAILNEQIAYYRARATEYDEWFLRQGRYDRGPELNAQWFADVAQVRGALAAFAPRGDVLEFACGTGLWTQELVKTARTVTAVDASPEVIAINRERLGNANVRHIEADILSWRPDRLYDTVFFSFWLSHVPPDRFDGFWETARASLRPGGRVFLIDSQYEETSTATDHTLEGADAATITRRLNDGREFRIVKVFYRPETLTQKLTSLGWHEVGIRNTERYFLYGEASR